MDNVIFYTDLIRFVLVSVGAVLIGVSARVILQYYRASRYAMKEGDFRGILPMHVWLISASYTFLVFGSLIYNVDHIGSRPDVYLAIDAAAYASGSVALWLILRFESRRVQEGKMEERRHALQRRLEDMTTQEFKIEREGFRRRVSDPDDPYPDEEQNEDEPDGS